MRAEVGWVCPHSPLPSTASPPPPCRLKIPPFQKARTVLEALQQRRQVRVQGGMHIHLLVQATKGMVLGQVSSD